MLTGVQVLVLAMASALPSPVPSATPSPIPSPAVSASPAAQALFTPPKHWRKTALGNKPADVTRFIASFERYVDGYPQEFNILEGSSAGMPLADYADLNIKMIATSMKVRPFESRLVATCGGHPAWLVKYHAKMYGRDMTFTQEFALGGSRAYAATYGRLSTQKDDPDAIEALGELCPPPEQDAATDLGAVPMQPPDGWKRLNPSLIGSSMSDVIVGLWMGDATGGFPQSINIIRSPISGNSQSMAAEVPMVITMLKQKYPSLVMRQSHAERLCEKYDGWYMEYSTHTQGVDVILEQTTVLADNVMYIASYGRGISAPENAAARKAIDSLCPTDAKLAS